jgi:hypothetical protein
VVTAATVAISASSASTIRKILNAIEIRTIGPLPTQELLYIIGRSLGGARAAAIRSGEAPDRAHFAAP